MKIYNPQEARRREAQEKRERQMQCFKVALPLVIKTAFEAVVLVGAIATLLLLTYVI